MVTMGGGNGNAARAGHCPTCDSPSPDRFPPPASRARSTTSAPICGTTAIRGTSRIVRPAVQALIEDARAAARVSGAEPPPAPPIALTEVEEALYRWGTGQIDAEEAMTMVRDACEPTISRAEPPPAPSEEATWAQRASEHRERGEVAASRLAADISDGLRWYRLHIESLARKAVAP